MNYILTLPRTLAFEGRWRRYHHYKWFERDEKCIKSGNWKKSSLGRPKRKWDNKVKMGLGGDMSSFKTPSISRLYTVKWYKDLWIVNLEESYPSLIEVLSRHFPEGLRKSTNYLQQKRRFPSRDKNRVPPEHKSTALPLHHPDERTVPWTTYAASKSCYAQWGALVDSIQHASGRSNFLLIERLQLSQPLLCKFPGRHVPICQPSLVSGAGFL